MKKTKKFKENRPEFYHVHDNPGTSGLPRHLGVPQKVCPARQRGRGALRPCS